MPLQSLFQNDVMLQIAMLSRHASSFRSLMYIWHRRISLYAFSDSGYPGMLNSSQQYLHTLRAVFLFLLLHLHLLHEKYVLLATGIQTNAKTGVSFFPSARHFPIGYTALASHGRNE